PLAQRSPSRRRHARALARGLAHRAAPRDRRQAPRARIVRSGGALRLSLDAAPAPLHALPPRADRRRIALAGLRRATAHDAIVLRRAARRRSTRAREAALAERHHAPRHAGARGARSVRAARLL